MRYRYEDLGDEDFQRLVQALLAGTLGRGLRAMPLGMADGGRDALHDVVVFQVKFAGSPGEIADPVKWLLDALDAEAPKIKRLVARGTREYILVTNVGGTGVLDRGTIDRLEQELKSRAAAWGLQTVGAWWRNEVDAHFDNASISTKIAYLRALPTDQALAITLLDTSQSAQHVDRVLGAYLADQYSADDRVRFEQVDLAGPTVDKLFVDVAVSSGTPGGDAAALLRRLGDVHDGDPAAPEPDPAQPVVGGARLLLHRGWRGNALIVGGPGQSKTTLLQYVCQVHRSRHLRRDTYLKTLPQQHLTATARIPFRVDLRHYAAWPGIPVSARRRDRRRPTEAGVTRALEAYLAEHVRTRNGGQGFTVDQLVKVFADRPVLLALDGLDEVADLSERERVATEIAAAEQRLRQNAVDLVILVTTRPGATVTDTLPADQFPSLIMQRLTTQLRLAYLGRWAEQANLDRDQTEELRRTFIDKQNLPHVRELASNPMQLAILLHLMQRRGILPEQRTELYADYVKVFLDREAPKAPVVRRHRALVEDVHAFLAWHLQSEAERGRSNGALSDDQLRRLLDDFLREHGDRGQLVQQLFIAVTSRVICLVQRPAGLEFEVQPLREYFAARHLEQGAPLRGEKNTKDDRLDALLRRPYWSNVLRFFAGMLSKGEVRGLPSNLRTVQEGKQFDALPLTRAVAVQLLDDQVFIRQGAGPVRDMVDTALDGPGAVLAADRLLSATGGELRLGPGSGRDELADHVRDRLPRETDRNVRRALAKLLAAHAEAADIKTWWWGTPRDRSGAWMATAADLGVLYGLNDADAAHLVGCATAPANLDDEPLAALLLRARSDCGYDGLLPICMAELADGAASGMRPCSDVAPLEQLHRWMHPSQFYAHLSESPPPGTLARYKDVNTDRRRRSRSARAASGEWRAPADGLSNAHAGADRCDQPVAWLAALSAVQDTFGDCWLLREAVLTVPPPLLTVGERPALAAGSAHRALCAWARAATRHASDAAWWADQQPPTSDILAARTWLLALLIHARAATIVECASRIEEVLAVLPARDINAVLLACGRHRDAGPVRQLDLRDRLRTGGVTLSPVAGLLLYPVSFDSPRPELARLVLSAPADPITLGGAVATATADVIKEHQPKAIRIDAFMGSRETFAAGTIENSIKIAKPTATVAREILLRPEQWPTDVVRLAADTLATALAKLAPLAQIADRDSWFA